VTADVGAGREAFAKRAWRAAASLLAACHNKEPLGLDDLELLAQAAYLCGEDAASETAWIEANHRAVAQCDWARAARCAFWLGVTLQARSERAQASGWFAKAQRVLEDNDHDCVERGWLLVGVGLKLHHERNYEASQSAWEKAIEVGTRFHDIDLITTARQGLARILIKRGAIAEGAPLLDEAMVTVLADEVSPIPAGIIYCSVIEACQEIVDIARAEEYTEALSRWVDAQPDLVPYRGRCQIHRAEIMALGGRWHDAALEISQACERLVDPPQPQLGMALYQKAEIHRMRGEFDAAEKAYREANEKGFVLQPGAALLRLAQGQTDAAVAAITRAFEVTSKEVTRCRVLPPYIEITLAADDVEAAGRACEELAEIAQSLDSPLLRAAERRCRGLIQLAQGDSDAALKVLDEAWESLSRLVAPYEVARLRHAIGLASRAVGDDYTAVDHWQSARRTFAELGARPDLETIDELLGSAESREVPGGLSPRELEVLVLVARGKSNREIASELVISERTVARHLSNILAKLDVPSRTAASAFAFQNRLV
jgi:DNA-binding CsgD family transcriptional regulator